jgi:hypothetical protein
MEISEFAGSRYTAAMELFAEGRSLVFAGVGFQLVPPDMLVCRVESSWQQDSITEERARADLASAHRTLEHLQEFAPGFSALIASRHPLVVLFAGYGMGGIEICTEARGPIAWKPGFPIDGAPDESAKVSEPESPDPIRLKQRDHVALAYRVVGALLGFALLSWATATSSWGTWTIALFVLVTVGGAISYHILTAVTRCPGCNTRMINLAITSPETRRKLFRCSHCRTSAFLTEGFFWQSDFSG